MDNLMFLMSLAGTWIVGALIGTNSQANLVVELLIRPCSDLITDSVSLPSGFPCHDGLSSMSVFHHQIKKKEYKLESSLETIFCACVSFFTWEIFSLESLGQNARGFSLGLRGHVERHKEFVYVVAINDLGVPAKSFHSLLENIQVMLIHGGLTLAQTVHINDVDQIVELVVAGKGHGFPHGAFR